jgi:AmiR/NasT family two-component response regulator
MASQDPPVVLLVEDEPLVRMTAADGLEEAGFQVLEAANADVAPIFQAARHPKSFVSLDPADHLLTKAVDAEYAATMIVAWVTRFFPVTESTPV